ncbi:uncharacterized protein LOC112341035 [Selaginella moellendorffii]|uniref:uncharacterized protein LOC112341035 n=1 Tax=Selaginella moellendorffii TaxID=88036 RepID=UPI000D1C674F|nr:uncharacterized protein LOC112341035 [Selaginella moellendorffii]|eukprot:XP_024516166.1 uncharacterized protein LOC112341035 [Selaginella moellendorffii]
MALASSEAWKTRARLDFEDIPDCSSHSKPRVSSEAREMFEVDQHQEVEKSLARRFLTDLAKGGFDSGASFESLQSEVMGMNNGNGSTISEIKNLIQTITRDAKAMETLLSSTENSLDSCELNMKDYKNNRLLGDAVTYSSKYELEKMMLKDSIEDCRSEGLRLAEQIEMKRRELKHLENVAKLKDSYLQDNKILEALKGVLVLGISSGHISLQLRTYLPDSSNESFKLRDDAKKIPDCAIHELNIVFNAATLSIAEAELKPKDVEISEIVSAVQEDGDFFEKVAFIVKEVQNRIRWRKSASSRYHSRNRR